MFVNGCHHTLFLCCNLRLAQNQSIQVDRFRNVNQSERAGKPKCKHGGNVTDTTRVKRDAKLARKLCREYGTYPIA